MVDKFKRRRTALLKFLFNTVGLICAAYACVELVRVILWWAAQNEWKIGFTLEIMLIGIGLVWIVTVTALKFGDILYSLFGRERKPRRS